MQILKLSVMKWNALPKCIFNGVSSPHAVSIFPALKKKYIFELWDMRQWQPRPKVLRQYWGHAPCQYIRVWGWTERFFGFPGNLHSCMSRWHRSLLRNIWDPPFHGGKNSQHKVLDRAAGRIIHPKACLRTNNACTNNSQQCRWNTSLYLIHRRCEE